MSEKQTGRDATRPARDAFTYSETVQHRVRWRLDRQRYRRRLSFALDALCGIEHERPDVEIDYEQFSWGVKEREARGERWAA